MMSPVPEAGAARRAAERHLADLELLREIGAAAIHSADLQPLFERILDAICDALGVEITSLMLRDEQGHLVIRASRGLPGDLAAHCRLAPGEGVSGHVLATGEALLVDDIDRDGRFAPAEGGERYRTRSLLSVPIIGRDGPVGVLNVNNKVSGARFDGADLNILTTIAHQTALAIDNFSLVADLRRRTRELEAANRRLLQADRARARLVCNLSHELKTPLTSVLGYTDLLLNFAGQLDDEERGHFLQRVYRESQHLDGLISGMLQLFSLDSGTDRWQPQALDLEIPLADALKGQQQRIAERGLLVDLELADDLPEVWGDPDKVAILVDALVDNGVKFNRQGGRLVVRGRSERSEDGEFLHLQIFNEGRSIPPQAVEDVFERFGQLGDLECDKPAGIGLGLSICRAIVERMGGRIIIEPGSGEGTTIGVFLPVAGAEGVVGHEQE